MTDDELASARRAAASLRASHPHLGGVADIIDSLLARVDRLDGAVKINAIAVYGRQVEEERAERDRLRAAVAAGDRLADVCRDVHFARAIIGNFGRAVGRLDDLGAALDAWEAARRGESAP